MFQCFKNRRGRSGNLLVAVARGTLSRFNRLQPRDAFFLLRAKAAISAEIAMLAWLRIECIVGDSLRGLFYAYPSREQLRVGAHGDDRDILFHFSLAAIA